MKKTYTTPDMTITNIENKDVITVSSLKTNDTQSKFAKFSSSDF